jgi:hypothetical protein
MIDNSKSEILVYTTTTLGRMAITPNLPVLAASVIREKVN